MKFPKPRKNKNAGRKLNGVSLVRKPKSKALQATTRGHRPLGKPGRYVKKDKQVFKLTVGDCERCMVRRELYHHHIVHRANKHLRYMKENLIKLCRQCHAFAHAYPNKFEDWFKAVYADRYQVIEREKNVLEV